MAAAASEPIGEPGKPKARDLTPVGAVSSQCQNCGTALASDQRYCLNCGERRGKARFGVGRPAPATAVAVTTRPAPPRPSRISSGLVFVAFVGTLLLAMGVGVLIGHTNNSQPVQRASGGGVQVVTVGAGAGSAVASGASAGNSSKHKGRRAKAAAKAPPVAKKVVVKAAAAAQKVLGGTNLPPATVSVGQKGKGPGFTNGKFTGDFFGGG